MNWTRLLLTLLTCGLVIGLSSGVYAQTTFTVSGVVLNPNGEALEGTTVREKETANGTITDGNGRFTLNVRNGDAVLVVTYIGMATQEVQVGNRSELTISLSEDVNSLDEVLVVGYGTQVKREITGNISSVKGEDLVKVPTASIDQGLQGMAAGVQVASASGVAGAPVRIQVRGTNSISANTEPLIVIDGMIVGSSLTTSIRATGGTGPKPIG